VVGGSIQARIAVRVRARVLARRARSLGLGLLVLATVPSAALAHQPPDQPPPDEPLPGSLSAPAFMPDAPTTGTVTVAVLVADYASSANSFSASDVNAIMNTNPKSVANYYAATSNGRLTRQTV
jgi:hypothetical protein